MMEITLIRHGVPTYDLTGKVRCENIPDVIRRYDLSGIKDQPPRDALEKASTSNVVVCSDLYRSIESARALGFSDIHCQDPVFREVAIPHFTTGSLAMSVGAWAVILRSLSVLGFSKNGESLSMAKQRARQATSTLVEVAQAHRSVLLVGHGFINYFIAKELLSRNWIGPSKPGGNFWDYGVYKFSPG